MCGRYSLSASSLGRFEQALEAEFDAIQPRYNIAPGQDNPVIHLAEGQPSLDHFRWGLVPHWSKEPRTKYSTINAKVETVAEKPFYRESFQSRRCLVPADGWYEWRKTGKGKQPYYIHRDGEPFAFAGLWEYWEGQVAEPFRSYTVLVGPAAVSVQPIHERMPWVLPEASWRAWMDPDTPRDAITDILDAPETVFDSYPVSRQVNNPKNEGPELVTRIPEDNS